MVLVGQQHDQTIHADAETAGGRQPVFGIGSIRNDYIHLEYIETHAVGGNLEYQQ